NSWHRSTAGSPRVLTQQICTRPGRCWRISVDKVAVERCLGTSGARSYATTWRDAAEPTAGEGPCGASLQQFDQPMAHASFQGRDSGSAKQPWRLVNPRGAASASSGNVA